VSQPGGPQNPGPEVPGEPAGGEPGQIVEDAMAGFRRTVSGVSARFTTAQAGIVRTLVSQVADLVGGSGAAAAPAPPGAGGAPAMAPGTGAAGEAGRDDPGLMPDPFSPEELAAMLGPPAAVAQPEDPVLARLFPDAYREDDGAAADFRRYTEQGLRSGKVAAARTVLATLPGKGGRVRLSAEEAQVWLRALNDVRLALGVRLGITEDYEHELAAGGQAGPRSAYLQVYDWLTFLQETLVRALW
jgi:Domain of unknown function (DUF2017)